MEWVNKVWECAQSVCLCVCMGMYVCMYVDREGVSTLSMEGASPRYERMSNKRVCHDHERVCLSGVALYLEYGGGVPPADGLQCSTERHPPPHEFVEPARVVAFLDAAEG